MWTKRRSYTPAHRREAAHLVIDTSRTIAEIAREIGVGGQLLGRWVAIERAQMEPSRRRRWKVSGGSSIKSGGQCPSRVT